MIGESTVVREIFLGKIFVLKYFRGLGATTSVLLVLRTKVSPLGPVNRPCTAGIAVEPFWLRSAVLRLHIYVDCTTCYYSLLKIFRVKIFSWFEPTTKIF